MPRARCLRWTTATRMETEIESKHLPLRWCRARPHEWRSLSRRWTAAPRSFHRHVLTSIDHRDPSRRTRRRQPPRRLRPRTRPPRLRRHRTRLAVRHRRHRLALTSAATTRRGLYVAATRGSDENILYVVTGSDDVAEARDVLEGILATDRADVPAITQRHALAQAVPRPDTSAAATTPRCEIPDWFAAVLADAKRDLLNAQTNDAQHAARRAQAEVAAANADAAAADIAAATAPEREALHHAEARAADARWRHTAAAHQVDAAPRRQRRPLRNEFHIAEQQLERAETYLERTRQRAAPAVERHAKAVETQREARDHLQTIARLDATPPAVGHHRLHVQALNTWKHWAQGREVPDGALQTTVAVLARQRGPEQKLAVALRQDVATSPVERNARAPVRNDDLHLHVRQQDFGIEL